MNGAVGAPIKGRKKRKKMEVEKIVLPNSKIPQDSSGEESEIEGKKRKKPLCRPPLLL